VDLVAPSSIVLSISLGIVDLHHHHLRLACERRGFNYSFCGRRSEIWPGPIPPIMSGQHSKSKMAPQSSSLLLTQQATYVFYLLAAYYIVKSAYRIRMVAIDDFGPVIHEFDPYFNFRATEVRTTTRSTQKTAAHHPLSWPIAFIRSIRLTFTWFFLYTPQTNT
jgi:hypothetical protein